MAYSSLIRLLLATSCYRGFDLLGHYVVSMGGKHDVKLYHDGKYRWMENIYMAAFLCIFRSLGVYIKQQFQTLLKKHKSLSLSFKKSIQPDLNKTPSP